MFNNTCRFFERRGVAIRNEMVCFTGCARYGRIIQSTSGTFSGVSNNPHLNFLSLLVLIGLRWRADMVQLFNAHQNSAV